LYSRIEYWLACWRLSRMLVLEAGPAQVFARLRHNTGIEYAGEDATPISWPDWNPLHCVLCTSVWVGALLLLTPRWLHTILAASAITTLLEAITGEGEA
jgi:hypothetical protein